MQPYIDRYKIGELFNQQVVYGPVGCAFLAMALEKMARIIDEEINRRERDGC